MRNFFRPCLQANWAVIPVLFVLFYPGLVHSQPVDAGVSSPWQITVAPMGGKLSVIDDKFSSTPYSGVHWGISSALQFKKKAQIHELRLTYAKADLKMNNKEENTADENYFTADYTLLFSVTKSDASPVIIDAGGAVQMLYANRNYAGYINASAASEFAVSLSAVGSVRFRIGDEHGVWFGERLMIPFISSVNYPGEGYGSTDINSVLSFSSFLRLNNRLTIEKMISQRGTIGLTYAWDYYRLSKNRTIHHADHQVLLSYGFNF